MQIKIIPIIICIVILGGIAYGASFLAHQNPGSGEVVCTQEALLCPDGSYVGRSGPKCEFAPCPTPPGSGTTGHILGTVLLGPTCPVERIPPDPACADKPYKTSLVLTTADGTVVKQFSSDANGKFSIDAPLGIYVIQSLTRASLLPRCSSNGTINVKANTSIQVAVSCDTGIR